MNVVRSSTFFLALALSIIWATSAPAKTFTIDDSGSEALEPAVSMRWKTAMPRSSAENLMLGTTTIRVRLNLLPWLRHTGRIFLSLPAQPPGPLNVSWTTQGRLMAGQVRSGNRVLVYAGPITAPFMEEVMRFQFSVDGRLLARAVPVTCHFEMDEE